METISTLKINTTDIILIDYGNESSGKVIISDNEYDINCSYYWGSMASNLNGFISRINPDYFASKLSNTKYVFSAKNTAKAIRKYIKENMAYELPWYKWPHHQKTLRAAIKEIESASCQNEALHLIENLHKGYDIEAGSYEEIIEFQSLLETHFNNEAWHFLETETSAEYEFLAKLLPLLKKKLCNLDAKPIKTN